MRTPAPLAIFFSDLHLSLTPPVCRQDKDWLAVQAGYLEQVKALAGSAPIICAGDIFDRWNAPAELIHFALEHLPDGLICVPGQHDLPNHRTDLMHRSAYGVLKASKKIEDLSDQEWLIPLGHKIILYGFGWEQEIIPPSNPSTAPFHIAVVHRYVWTEQKCYPDAPPANHVNAMRKALKGYHAAFFGDNHKGFAAQAGNCQLVNCGGFIRRKSDEVRYRPRAWVLEADGSIIPHALDTTEDVFAAQAEEKEHDLPDMQKFLEELTALGEEGVDFRKEVKRYLTAHKEVTEPVRKIILTAMQE